VQADFAAALKPLPRRGEVRLKLPPIFKRRTMISFSALEQKLKATYDIRLDGSLLLFRPASWGPYRAMPGLLGSFLKKELSRCDFGGQGHDRSGFWYADFVSDFQDFIMVDCPVLDKRTERTTSIPETTVKHLIKFEEN
jgi:hypothetical protein